ncbi:TetR/AcrR family transcriptional regulator [Planococcus sp. N064]|uniref:TetR/AcrR family transcriptional regulator n=1 Tax=Planococcus liqunii TaxID=3058394 RepID=A0ABT8MVM3_9BACL|nr:TetR/AcrR family transcriptional regulator [Planococcus sp. N064]MDN7228953.1 TetR/AcrR family transcriptional regulator [Planococcus sp. N064]
MKAKIKQQSISLFEQKGFSETSIQDIVEALGVTKGTFYYYFPSKEQLLMDIHSNYIDDLLSRQKAIQETVSGNQQKLQAIVELLIGDIQDQGPSGRVFFREMRHLTPENSQKVKRKREQFRLNIEKLISDGIAAGEFRSDLPSGMVAFAVLGVTNWSYQWFNPNGGITAGQLAEIYSDMILNGIT